MAKVTEHRDSQPVGKRSDTMRALIIEASQYQNKLDKDIGSISNRLLMVAKSFQEKGTVKAKPNGERLTENSERFNAATLMEEKFIRSSEAGELKRDTLPKCWTQAKSNIKAAIELGIDLAKYNSESALRKEVVRVRGLLKNVNPVDQAIADLKNNIKVLSQEKALSILKQALGAVMVEVEAIKKAERAPIKKAKTKQQARKPATKKQARKPATKQQASKPAAKKQARKPAAKKAAQARPAYPATGNDLSEAQLIENLEAHILAEAS